MLVGLTVLTAALVSVTLIGYLIGVARTLLRARRSVTALADYMETIQRHTEPLPRQMPAINAALGALRDRLAAADDHVSRAAHALRP